jgi:hypothetical protein
MARPRKSAFERNASNDLWKHTLSHIPTVYGRLYYLASLRDPGSNVYRHHGLAAMFGRDESSRALREKHEELFLEWLAMPLRERKLDLARYFSTLEGPMETLIDSLLTSGVYRTQPPASALRMEQNLFCVDLETLLQTLKARQNGRDSGREP